MQCICCNKETANPKFCSRSCAAIINNRINPKRMRKTACAMVGCENITKSYRHTKCELHWDEHLKNKQSNKTLAEFHSLVSSLGKHPSWKNALIRTHARRAHKKLLTFPCAKCGYEKHVELCHIKPIVSFPSTALLKEVNAADNVIQLCPNCHWEFDNLDK